MTARRIGAATLLVIATLLWTAACFGVWAKRQALNTDNWVDTTAQMLQNQRIRTTLGTVFVDRLYDTTTVEAQIRNVLPPRLDRLAAPAAAGFKEVALRNAPRVLGTDTALTAWKTANRQAHRAVLALVDGKVAPNGEVTLNVQDLLRQLATGTGLPAGAADKIPPSVAQIKLLQSSQIKTAQDAVAGFRDAVWVLIVLAIAAFAGAIYLREDRRRTFISVGFSLIAAGIAVLALRRLGGVAVVNALADAPNAHAIAGDVWGIGTSLLVDVAEGTLLFGLFLASAAWLSGPGRVPVGVRRASAPMFRDHPGVAHGGLGVAILLLVLWGPVPWTQRIVPVLIFTVAAFVWLEWLRRRTVEEFPDVRAGEFRRMVGGGRWFGGEKPDETVPSG
jgi:hypothetical protein